MLHRTRTDRGRESGLTLIEILISMIILSIITTFLVIGWINMQRGAAFAVTTNDTRSVTRDAISRVGSELRAAQPTALPSVSASATAMPAGYPPLQTAGQWSVQFYSAFNNPNAVSDGTGVAAGVLRKTWIYVHVDGTTPGAMQTLYLKRDLNNNGTFDAGDLTIILAKNVVNKTLYDANGQAQEYSLFVYGYRTSSTSPVLWTDNRDGTLDLTTVVAVRSRVIVDVNPNHSPKYIDTTTTVRLRNASGG